VVSGISFNTPATIWSHYAADRLEQVPSNCSLSRYSQDTGVLGLLLRELRTPCTVLDLGGNDGFFGLHAAAAGARVVINDLDELALARGIQRADLEPSWKVAFVVNDAMISEFSELPNADIVLALALTHHLRLTQGYFFSEIASRFAALTRRVLLTQFMPWGLQIERPPEDLPPDYTLETFLNALAREFSSVEVVGDGVVDTVESGPTRILIRCTK
jgi:hypothetical protein